MPLSRQSRDLFAKYGRREEKLFKNLSANKERAKYCEEAREVKALSIRFFTARRLAALLGPPGRPQPARPPARRACFLQTMVATNAAVCAACPTDRPTDRQQQQPGSQKPIKELSTAFFFRIQWRRSEEGRRERGRRLGGWRTNDDPSGWLVSSSTKM